MRRFLVFLFLLSLLSACAEKTETVTTLAPPVPYQTSTPSEFPTLVPPLTGMTLPTPTTFTYTVIQGDTLIGIATRYGLTPEALMAANPDIQPASLPVGTILILPTDNWTPVAPTPTPVPIPILQARCWPEMDGGAWCFALLKNDNAETLENLSARFALLDTSGHELASQAAFAYLDILPPAGSMPLAVHFPPPVQAGVLVSAQVLTAIRLLPGDSRYLPVTLDDTLVSLDVSGRTAQVTGKVSLIGTVAANTLWVLATAYDASGNVVGVRRWESSSALAAGAPVSFDFLVSSIGPAIDRVEFLAEARP